MSVFIPNRPLVKQHADLMSIIRAADESSRRIDDAAEERLP